jgi:hypothetical protein
MSVRKYCCYSNSIFFELSVNCIFQNSQEFSEKIWKRYKNCLSRFTETVKETFLVVLLCSFNFEIMQLLKDQILEFLFFRFC